MSAARIAKLATTLMRGLDVDRQDSEHDERFAELLAEYCALVDAERGTCLRPERKRLQGQSRLMGVR